jgi:hypothetical protein
MRKLFSVLSLVVLFSIVSFGQAQVTIPLTATDGIGSNNGLAVGLDLTATNGIDPSLGESDLPPFPPSGVFEVRFDLAPYAGSALSTYWDFRNAPAFPFTGVVEHTLIWQYSTGASSLDIGYDVPAEATMTITDNLGGIVFNSGPLTGTGVFTIPPPLTTAIITMDYTNIGPSGPAPEFEITPTSLDFGPVGVGVPSAPLQATVSNPGTDPLTISNIVSSNPDFTFAPNTFPITVNPGAGNEVVFDVTFTPSVLGPITGDITFTSDAPSSPDVLTVQGVGADAGPTFGVSPTSLTFPTVFVGNSADQFLTVTNNGLTNTLNISSVVATNAVDYSVTPATATIAPGANEVFTVTFAPSVDGTLTTDIVFTHDGSTSPDAVPVTGVGFTPPTVSGLVFSEDTAFVPENTSDITATMQLLGNPPGVSVHALQFKLQSNMVVDDETILTFQSITKSGSIASNPDWVLETNVVRGTINPNGASEDVIYCLLYNIGNGGLTGDWTNLMQVTYKTAVLPPLTPSQKSSFNIIDAEGSTVDGNYVDITPSDPTLEVIVEAAGGTYGDVNGDGCVDILDLIMVVDHIVGRDSLTGAEFDRADLAPWPGTPEPTPDGFVNVQDLSVIQSIILTGFYPNGDPVTPCGYLSKVEGAADATVTLYINSEGISAYVDADVGIRGAQIEFTSVSEDPENLVINTPLGQGYYDLSEGLFRTLMYDRAGQKYIDAGVNNFMADMPFALVNSQDVEVAKIVLVDNDVKKIGNIVVQTIYGTTALPLDYILFQNYPNPFNPTTAVKFQVPKTSDVKIAVYDMLGQEVRTLFAGEVVRGTYTVDWNGFNNDGSKVASGTYIYRMTAGDFIQSKKMVLIK